MNNPHPSVNSSIAQPNIPYNNNPDDAEPPVAASPDPPPSPSVLADLGPIPHKHRPEPSMVPPTSELPRRPRPRFPLLRLAPPGLVPGAGLPVHTQGAYPGQC